MAICSKKVDYRLDMQQVLRVICKEFKIPYDHVYEVKHGCQTLMGYAIRCGELDPVDISTYWTQHGRKKRKKARGK